MPGERPIFVVGFQRSGTTFLQSLLGAHPRIAAPPETHFILRVADLADWFGDLGDDGNLRRALHEALNPPLPLFADCGFEEDRLFERARATDRTYGALLDVIMSDFAERQGKARWCEKSPGQPAASVVNLFPDAQLVHLVRDPRDVVASSMEVPWTGRTARELAGDWRRFTLDNIRVGAEIGTKGFLQVRYEDLARDPGRTLAVICAFLEEEMAPEMLSRPDRRQATIAAVAAPWHGTALENRPPPSSGGWRSRLTPAQRLSVAAIVRHALAPLGYPPPRPPTVVVGHLCNALAVAEHARHLQEGARQRRVARSPERRYREVQRYLQDRASDVRRSEATPAATRGGGNEPAALPEPVVPAAAYDEEYYLTCCAGYEEWNASRGAEPAGVYAGALARAGVGRGDTVVDIGTGRAELLAVAVELGAARAVGVEYSDAAIRLGAETLARHGVADRTVLLRSDARRLPLPTACADLVTMLDVVEHLTPAELHHTLCEAHRVLRPGGRVFAHTMPNRSIYELTYRVQRSLTPRRRRHWPSDPRNDYERKMHVNEQTVTTLSRALRRAGFATATVELGKWIYSDFVPDERAQALYSRLARFPPTARLGVADIWAEAVRH